MEDQQLRLYIAEVTHQSRIAQLAMQALEEEIAGPWGHETIVRVMSAAQAVLTAAAQISKLTNADVSEDWSEERRAFAIDRAASVRKIIKPAELLHRRAIRSSVEHFDARIDDVFRNDPHASIADSNFGPISAMHMPGVMMLRHFDPDTLEYSILGKTARLPDVCTALREASGRAQRWLDERTPPWRFPA